jgi:putative membrane protein
MSGHVHIFDLLFCGIPIALYGIGVTRQLCRNHIFRAGQLAFGIGGFAILAFTVFAPLHHLGERLFTAHMIEHELLMAVAAPLIVLAEPALPMLWSLPRSARRAIWSLSSRLTTHSIIRPILLPASATILHGAAIWVWHAPPFFNAAVELEWIHWLQHASFFLTALLFWWAMLVKAPATRKDGLAIGHLFATAMHTGLLGALMTFSTRLWYPASAGTAEWGLTAIEDQQLAGLVMWIPGGLAYALPALWLAARWISQPRRLSYAHAS